MEPHKRAEYSKSLDPDEIEEVLLDEDSDEELEDRDKVVEPRVQSSSSSENEDDSEETEVAFRTTRAGDSSNFLNFTGPPSGVNRSAASDINAENVTASGISRGRPSQTAYQLSQLEVQHSQHWPARGTQRRCRVCSLQKQTRTTLYFCRKCDVGLCIVDCFEIWHTRMDLSH